MSSDSDNLHVVQSQTLFPTQNEWVLIKQQALVLVKSGFLPDSIRTPEQCVTIMLKGRELGVPPLSALSQISVIKGKPTISSELMLGLIYTKHPKAEIHFKENSNSSCVIEAKRSNEKNPSTFSFTMQDAESAELTRNQTWKKYPSNMLRARCISNMAKAKFPDCLMGCSYTPEELGQNVNEGSQEMVGSAEGGSLVTHLSPEATQRPAIEVVSEEPEDHTTQSFSDLRPSAPVPQETFPDPAESFPPPVSSSVEMYQVKFGKFKDKMLRDIPPKDLQSYAGYLERAPTKGGKPLSPDASEAISKIGQHLSQLNS